MSIKVNGKVVSGGPGKKGEDGKSAYQYAVDGGYTGTEEEFQAMLGSGPWLPLSGGTMSGQITVNSINVPQGNEIVSGPYDTSHGTHPKMDVSALGNRSKTEVSPRIRFYPPGYNPLSTVGDTETLIVGVATPVESTGAANKKYVDNAIQAAIDSSWAKAY